MGSFIKLSYSESLSTRGIKTALGGQQQSVGGSTVRSRPARSTWMREEENDKMEDQNHSSLWFWRPECILGSIPGVDPIRVNISLPVQVQQLTRLCFYTAINSNSANHLFIYLPSNQQANQHKVGADQSNVRLHAVRVAPCNVHKRPAAAPTAAKCFINAITFKCSKVYDSGISFGVIWFHDAVKCGQMRCAGRAPKEILHCPVVDGEWWSVEWDNDLAKSIQIDWDNNIIKNGTIAKQLHEERKEM